MRRGDKQVTDHTFVLAQVKMTHDHAEAALAIRITAITLARHAGCSWEHIGEALGMSRQTAHKRFAGVVDGLPGDGGD